ncbi:hypothetical protein L2E82_45235 [Cichorium intybus]|uniref:Uncharacterized protein n=1 Tax=Cichorium intybus TaxID=13427 RepID=A0ACB8ZTE4_CICIN|nr:hypothetical protein L2E82_45235 [Cichorium intybus]
MTSMNVPEPVVSLAVSPVSKDSGKQVCISNDFSLNRFQREDPTFRVGLDPESGQTIISGMGELHLEVYVERIKREYKVDATVGKPRVNFRETITQRAEFDYLHKKQSGGQGQYGRVVGYMELLPAGSETKFEFENMIIGQPIPSNFIPHIEKGLREAANLLASIYAFRQGTVAGDLNRRKGIIVGNDQEGDDSVINALVPLNNMFGYSTALRSMAKDNVFVISNFRSKYPVLQLDLRLISDVVVIVSATCGGIALASGGITHGYIK